MNAYLSSCQHRGQNIPCIHTKFTRMQGFQTVYSYVQSIYTHMIYLHKSHSQCNLPLMSGDAFNSHVTSHIPPTFLVIYILKCRVVCPHLHHKNLCATIVVQINKTVYTFYETYLHSDYRLLHANMCQSFTRDDLQT